MDFRFRAGDGRRSSLLPSSSAAEAVGDGYFAAQALRAGFFGNAGRRGDLGVTPPQPPAPTRERLQRELHKDRFREEMVGPEVAQAREAAQSRILLEEEVRRELGLERVMAARQHEMERGALLQPALYSEPVPDRVMSYAQEARAALYPEPVPDRVMSYAPEARAGERLGSFPRTHSLDLGLSERLPPPLPRRPNVGFLESPSLPPAHRPEVGFPESGRLPPPLPHHPEVGFVESHSLLLAHRPEVRFPESGRLPPPLPHRPEVGFLESPSLPLAHRPEVGFPESGRLPPPLPHLGFLDRPSPPLAYRPEVGFSERPPRPEPVKKKKQPWFRHEPREHEVITLTEGNMPWKSGGSKRKAATDEGADDLPQPTKRRLSCDLCQVFTITERDLKWHLQGRKHRAKERSLDTNKPAARGSTSLAKEADKASPTNGPAKKDTSEGFWCNLCNVKCYSQAMLDSHLGGKKHKAQLEEPGKDNKPVMAQTDEKQLATAEESGKGVKPVKAEEFRKHNKQPVKDVKPVQAEESVSAAKRVTKVVKKKVVKKEGKKVTQDVPASED